MLFQTPLLGWIRKVEVVPQAGFDVHSPLVVTLQPVEGPKVQVLRKVEPFQIPRDVPVGVWRGAL
eukprot:4844863-Alexandrium_andersonii.AAC.1